MIGANSVCDVLERKTTTDSYGGETVTFETHAEDVPCRFIIGKYHQRLQLKTAGASEAEVATHQVILPADTTVEVGWGLEWKGEEYKVLSADDIDGHGHHIECHVVRLGGT